MASMPLDDATRKAVTEAVEAKVLEIVSRNRPDLTWRMADAEEYERAKQNGATVLRVEDLFAA